MTDTATTSSSVDVFRRPHRLWYLAIHGGLSSMAAMSLSQGAYDAISAKVPVPPRRAVQAAWLLTGAVHVAEATYAYRFAKAHGMPTTASRWAREVFFLGFPALLEQRAVAAGR